MKRSLHFILYLFLLSGCATVQTVSTPDPIVFEEPKPVVIPLPVEEVQTVVSPSEKIVYDEAAAQIEESSIISEDVPAEEEVAEEDVEPMGVIFAKTDFLGLLKVAFVDLMISGQGEEAYTFQLSIGREAESKPFTFDVKPVEPGYFLLELPVGHYKITSIAIPVGSTKAIEAIDIDFQVLENTVNYLGTLRVEGTKEKIKLGGVPVIKPGFEYNAQIFDETAEAFKTFQTKYPDMPQDINVNLMVLHAKSLLKTNAK